MLALVLGTRTLPLQTDDGALILMTYRGIRHSSAEVAKRIALGQPVL